MEHGGSNIHYTPQYVSRESVLQKPYSNSLLDYGISLSKVYILVRGCVQIGEDLCNDIQMSDWTHLSKMSIAKDVFERFHGVNIMDVLHWVCVDGKTTILLLYLSLPV